MAEAMLRRVLDTFLKFRFYLVGTGKVLKDFKEITSALRIGGKKKRQHFERWLEGSGWRREEAPAATNCRNLENLRECQ